MADIEGITLRVTVDGKEVTQEFNRIEKSAKQTGKDVEKGLSSGFKVLKTRLLGLGAAFAAAFAGKKIIDAAVRQEDAVNRLNQSLRNSGSFSKAASKDLQEFASQIQETSILGDEAALEMLALAKSFGVTNDQAKKLVQGAVNLSAATGISLEGAVKNLGKSFGGMLGELGETTPELKRFSVEALKSGAAVDFMNRRFAGAGQALTKTFSGAVSGATNVFGDLLERLGFFITKNPLVIGAINAITIRLNSLVKAIDGFIEGGGIKEITDNFVAYGKALVIVAGLVGAYVVVVNGAAIATAAFNLVSRLTPWGLAITGVTLLVAGIGFLIKNFDKLVGRLQIFSGEIIAKFSEPIKTVLLSIGEFAGTFSDSLAQKFRDAASGVDGLAEKLKTEGAARLMEAAAPLEDAGKMAGDGFNRGLNEALEKSSDKIKAFGNTVNNIINGSMVRAVSGGIQATVNAIKKGSSAWVGFRDMVVSVIASTLISLGEAIIAQAIAIDALAKQLLNPFGGGVVASVALGLALITLGSILSSAVSKGAAAGAGVGGGGVAAGGADAAIAEPEAVTSPEELTRVTVNVQGNVLDRKSAGLELVEVLNEAFDSQGARLAQAGGLA